jgi:alkylated DNA repair dioxygenase AlkB
MKDILSGFDRFDLGSGCNFWVGRLPDALLPDSSEFEALWQMHPEAFHEIQMYGRAIKTPRWQQAYGIDYHYTGRVNKALPIPPRLQPFLDWSRETIDGDLNALLLNWYEGKLGHYIGRHRDSTTNLIPGAPIVTISLGEKRTFRLRHWSKEQNGKPMDFQALAGSVFIMPGETNQAFTHEVPPATRQSGRRISITLRGFLKGQDIGLNRSATTK